MINGQEISDQARLIAVKDGEVEGFDKSIAVAHRLASSGNNKSMRFVTDFSLPKHSVLAVITREDGSLFYMIGIVRHSDGTWSANS